MVVTSHNTCPQAAAHYLEEEKPNVMWINSTTETPVIAGDKYCITSLVRLSQILWSLPQTTQPELHKEVSSAHHYSQPPY